MVSSVKVVVSLNPNPTECVIALLLRKRSKREVVGMGGSSEMEWGVGGGATVCLI